MCSAATVTVKGASSFGQTLTLAAAGSYAAGTAVLQTGANTAYGTVTTATTSSAAVDVVVTDGGWAWGEAPEAEYWMGGRDPKTEESADLTPRCSGCLRACRKS